MTGSPGSARYVRAARASRSCVSSGFNVSTSATTLAEKTPRRHRRLVCVGLWCSVLTSCGQQGWTVGALCFSLRACPPIRAGEDTSRRDTAGDRSVLWPAA
jgi:hypothetical protein